MDDFFYEDRLEDLQKESELHERLVENITKYVEAQKLRKEAAWRAISRYIESLESSLDEMDLKMRQKWSFISPRN